MRGRIWLCSFLFATTVGCFDDGDYGTTADPNDPAPPGANGTASTPSPAGPGSSPLRRLTRTEYDNTVRDLLGDTSRPATGFSEDKRINGFDNNVDGLAVSSIQVEGYIAAAITLSETAVAGNLSALLGCAPSDATCARSFIERFGQRAHRRALTSSEVDAYVALYDTTKAGAVAGEDPITIAVRQVIQAMLLSPDFLYRVEEAEGADGDVVPVTGMKMASRLSYLLWSSMPDDALFDAAARGELVTADQIEAQARRMMSDPKAKNGLENFLSQWMQIYKLDYAQKSAALYPEFTPVIVRDMKIEAKRFFEEIFWTDGNAKNLLTAQFTFVNPALAAYYDLAAPPSTDFQKVDLAASGRQGALTLGAVMAALATDVTDPIHRGQMVTQNLLCKTIPEAPAGLAIVAPELDPTKDNRTRLSVIQENPTCAGCHRSMERVGFGFEHFSAIGKWQDHDPNTPTAPIDATGEIVAGDAAGTFNGAAELSTKIANSTDYTSCVAQKFYQFAIGRSREASDADALMKITEQFAAGGYDIKELMVAYVRSTPFRFRNGGPQ